MKKLLRSSRRAGKRDRRSRLVTLFLLCSSLFLLSVTADDYVECTDPIPDEFLPGRESCRQHVAKVVANLSQRSTPLSPRAIEQIVRLTFGQEQSFFDQFFQVPLKRSAVDLRT